MSKAAPSKDAKKAGRPTPGEGPVKVLLAEDEESFIEALVIGLTNEGFRVTVARDGNEALQLFDETVPDILLLDLMLPKLSGIDVCRAIRHALAGAHHHGDGQGHRDRHRRGARGGRGRLRHQALPLARARGPHARRVCDAHPGGSESGDLAGSIEFGSDGIWESNGIKVDFDQRRVFVRGEEVHLRRKEFELLRLLVENSGRVLDPRRAHRPRAGAPTTSVTPRRSTSTSSGCAPASRPTLQRPFSSLQCAAWATASPPLDRP